VGRFRTKHNIIDLRFEYRDKADAASRQAINTAVTLQAGVPITVLGAPAQAGKEPPLRVKAEVMTVVR